MNDVDARDATTPESSAAPWAELLSSEKLKKAGLKMETLAEQVGVSAAYLRLLRQGKRTASSETAARLFKQLGYEVETKRTEDRADIIAKDGQGRVFVAYAKSTKAARPSSLEQTLEEILQTTKELQERVPPVEAVSWSEDWASFIGDTHDEDVAGPQDEPWRLSRQLNRFAQRGGWAPLWASKHALSVPLRRVGPGQQTAEREDVERLLHTVPDHDLPLVAAYLSLLVERSQRPSPDADPGAEGASGESNKTPDQT